TLVAYLCAPRRAKNAVLLVASVVFYAWGERFYILLVAASVLANWGFGLALARTDVSSYRRRWLALAVTVNLATLALFKYANFGVDNLNALAPVLALITATMPAISLPLGISFFTFHAISYVIDVYKRNAQAEQRLPDFALYILLFPQLIAGPIIRWRDIATQLRTRETALADIAYGVRRFILGLGKKVLIANTLGEIADRIFGLPTGDLTTNVAWLGLVCYTLQIYFDFSGYSDMAIGLMRMFGFRVLENFNYPYIAQSIREFWRRWHISLSNWFRDYLYIPLGGNQRGPWRAYFNLIVVFLLCGLWHGASWPFVVWGAWHGLFLVVERAGLDRVLQRIGPLRHIYTLFAVMGGWVLFRCDTLTQAIAYFQVLGGFPTSTSLHQTLGLHLNPLVITTLVVAVIGATPVARILGTRRDAMVARGYIPGLAAGAADIVTLAAIFIAAVAWLAASTYNPFIYFRF
ncbi:MAG: MBOAT family protein, partial [Betaproteobacteria bacterium]